MTKTILLFTLVLVLAAACVRQKEKASKQPLQTVPHVDLGRYAGEWYEIARYPNRFQENCPASKATYSLLPSGKIEVLNECCDLDYQQTLRSVTGTARVVDKDTNARLKVTFFRPFSGDYWIIDLGADYEYAVVGHPRRKYLWILARSPEIPALLYEQITSRLKSQGYDPEKLIRRKNSFRP